MAEDTFIILPVKNTGTLTKVITLRVLSSKSLEGLRSLKLANIVDNQSIHDLKLVVYNTHTFSRLTTI